MKNRISFIGVTFSAVLFMALGAFWYGFFAEVWAKNVGISMEDANASMTLYFLGFLIAWTTCLSIGLLINRLEVTTISKGVGIGLLAWLGFTATCHLNSVLWAGKSLTLFFIDAGYYFVATAMASFILTIWRRAPAPSRSAA